MKKTLIIAVAVAAITSLGVVKAAPVNLDTLPKITNTKASLQRSYLDSLRMRYRNMYNRRLMTRDYFNVKTRRRSLKKAQKAAHVVGELKSILARTGELEKDKERVQPSTPYQVEAVNPKSIFLKRAMDYYVYNGDAGTEIMNRGNINMRDHKVSRTKMLDLMYKHKRSIRDITFGTREMQKSMVGPKYENTKKRTANYRTGDFKVNMLSPFTSLKWLDR